MQAMGKKREENEGDAEVGSGVLVAAVRIHRLGYLPCVGYILPLGLEGYHLKIAHLHFGSAVSFITCH
jgi:hypothetical protein